MPDAPGAAADPWYGGLEPELDGLILPGKPHDPEMRESASIWLFEENGAFALPRVGIEAVGARWDRHRVDCNVALPDGRILRQSARRPALPTRGLDGRATVLGAGGLRFECIEPYRRWRVSFDDLLYEGTAYEQMRGNFRIYEDVAPDPATLRTPVRFDVEITMATPGWTQDFRPERLAGLNEQERTDAGLMGYGWRVEHCFRGEGEITIGEETRAFRAVGNRIHRQSVRPMGAFRGHCWQAALFPDNRAFGLCAYPPRADGSTYNDAYIYQHGRMWKARATRIPFLHRIMAGGDDVSLELESELGVTRIGGTTTLGQFHIGNPGVNGMNNHQSCAVYDWDGMTACGMIERSSPASECILVE